MPPFGPNDGEKIEVKEGEDSVCRSDCRPCGVGGTSIMLLEKERSKPGVRMVRFAGLRRELFGGACIGDGGAERCWDPESTGAVAMGGRDDCEGGGMRRERFLRLRARRPGESGRFRFGTSDDRLAALFCVVESVWLSMLWAGGMNLGYDNGMEEGDSGEELGEVSAADGESKVEMVVVGEDSVEAEATDETLSRCRNGSGRRAVLTVT